MVYFLSSSIILFSFAVLTLLPTCLCRLSKEFRTCSQPFKCGNVTDISYPFYGLDRPSYCGHPGFELSGCDQTAEPIGMMILSHEFIVVGINITSSTINVSRKDYYTRSGCPSMSLDNITIDFSLFNYTPLDVNLTLVYGDCASRCNSSWWFDCPMNPTTKLPFCFLTKNAMLRSNISEMFCPNHLSMPIHLSGYLAMDAAGGYNPTVAWNGFELQWNANNGLCDECLRSGGQCGHEPLSNKFFCFCTDESKCPFPGSTPYKATLTKSKIAVIACFSALGLGILIVLVFFLRRRCASNEEYEPKRKPDVEAFLRNHGSVGLQRYTYSDLKRMTSSFKEKLGEGGYGVVYKGRFLNTEHFVAVKMLKKPEVNVEEFINEVASIGNTNHVNVVSLRGFCYEGRHRGLVYDYMLNGSLEKYLYGRSTNERLLSWEELFQIAVGTARGLEYLHRGCNTRILHFDIKPHNILLDEHFCPKISDFGLAKLCPQKDTIVSLSGARGTVGYIAPEVFLRSFGGVSYKSDVYSYGMLVLEIVGCRRNARTEGDSEKYFPQWIYEQLEVGEGFDDGQEMLSFEEMEIQKKMILVSLMCVRTNPSSRPEMSRVVELLEGSIETLQIPRISSLAYPASVVGSSSHAHFSSPAGSLSSQPWPGPQSSSSSMTPTL